MPLKLSSKDMEGMMLQKLKKIKRIIFRFFTFIKIKKSFSSVSIKDLFGIFSWPRRMKYGDNLILEIPYPGIGDHLFYSNLPELVVKSGLFKNVYISNYSKFGSAELLKLVWLDNPYISGVIDKKGWTNSGFRPQNGSFLDGIVYQFTKEIPKYCSTKPKLYQEKSTTKNEVNYFIIDFNRITNKDELNLNKITEQLDKKLNELADNFKFIYIYDCELFREVLSQSLILQKLNRDKKLMFLNKEQSLADYFSRIMHASCFFGLYSGGPLIAVAYGVPTVVFCEQYDPTISFANAEYLAC